MPSGGWSQIVAFAGYYELFVYKYTGTPGASSSEQTCCQRETALKAVFFFPGGKSRGNIYLYLYLIIGICLPF